LEVGDCELVIRIEDVLLLFNEFHVIDGDDPRRPTNSYVVADEAEVNIGKVRWQI
jgi:hypothetical protein